MIAPRTDGSPPHRQSFRIRRVIHCEGAQLSVSARGLATIIGIEGAVDASNAICVATEIRQCARLKMPVIIDLRRLGFLGLAGFRELLAFNNECRKARRHCSVVGGIAVRPLLRLVGDHGLTVTDSVPEALQIVQDSFQARRRGGRTVGAGTECAVGNAPRIS